MKLTDPVTVALYFDPMSENALIINLMKRNEMKRGNAPIEIDTVTIAESIRLHWLPLCHFVILSISTINH